MQKRIDEWTEKEDEIILNNALKAIREGGTLKASFINSAIQLKRRTHSAVHFRYYNVIKINHASMINHAHLERVERINRAEGD